jgi:hypothetical protein
VEEKKRRVVAKHDVQRQSDAEDGAIRRYVIHVEREDPLAKHKEMLTLRNDWQLQAGER